MAYSAGSTILDDDYNGFATSVNGYWGSGSGDSGYGQTNTISSVAAGATITATQWSTLLTRISSAASHQGTSITSITNPVAGNTIEAYAALSSNITATQNGRSNAAANGTDITTNGTVQTTSAWSTQATVTRTVTFSSATTLRYFFNAGGMIRLSFSRSGGTSSPQNDSWTNLLTACGTIVTTGAAASKTIAGTAYTGTTKIGGSGTPTTLLTATGAYALTGSPVAIFKQFGGTYLYTSAYVNINASISGSTISYAITLRDDYTTDVYNLTDSVDGTLTNTMVVRPPSTTYLSNTWGTPTMNSTSWSLT